MLYSGEWNNIDDFRKAVLALKRVLANAKDPNADELMTPFRYCTIDSTRLFAIVVAKIGTAQRKPSSSERTAHCRANRFFWVQVLLLGNVRQSNFIIMKYQKCLISSDSVKLATCNLL